MDDKAREHKRKSPPVQAQTPSKQFKKRREWQVPRKGFDQGKSIETGDAGIFVTCNRNQEAKCVNEIKDLFQEFAEQLYGKEVLDFKADPEQSEDVEEADIEAEIGAELKDMHKAQKTPLFVNIRLDVMCVCFVRTRKPVEPVSLVEAICKAASATSRRRTKWARRLTPMTCMGKATESGLREAALVALGPIFHGKDGASKKFAIRPSIRNHNTLTRDAIIKLVAAAVGPGHSVDLKKPDVSILVEVYTNVCGVSVVGCEYEALKRFNIAEIQAPSVSHQAKDGNDAAVEASSKAVV